MILRLDLGVVRGLHQQPADLGLPETEGHSLALDRAAPAVLRALERYLDQSGSPLDAQVLGPATSREIHYRLLLSPVGTMLRRRLVVSSRPSWVAGLDALEANTVSILFANWFPGEAELTPI